MHECRAKKPKKLIMAVLLALLFSLGTITFNAFGGTGYEVVGESNGLVIRSPLNPVDIANLNPGDRKHSRLILTNTNSKPIIVYIRTVIVAENTPAGGADLADGMYILIRDGTTAICSGTFRQAHAKGSIRLGQMAPGAQMTLEFYTDLPGEETDNSYQGSAMKVKWVFTTMLPGNGNGGNGGNGNGNGNGDKEDEPDTPGDGPETPEEEPPPMPKTGEGSPYPFYLAGACVIVAGALLLKMKSHS